VQLFDHGTGYTGLRASITPAVTGTVIRTDTGEASDFGLNKSPVKVRAIEAMLQDHGWTAFASAIKMKAVSTHRNQLSGGRIEAEIASLVRALINDSP
jgi:hypothetical protein